MLEWNTLIDAFPNAILRQDLKGILSGFESQFEVVDVFLKNQK